MAPEPEPARPVSIDDVLRGVLRSIRRYSLADGDFETGDAPYLELDPDGDVCRWDEVQQACKHLVTVAVKQAQTQGGVH